jgi:acetyl-CoA carboxylase beta subunit
MIEMVALDATKLRKQLSAALRNEVSHHWLLCPSCECGLTETDLETGVCTNCGVGLPVPFF